MDGSKVLLTFGDRRIIDDDRISIERPFAKDWNLYIRRTTKDDGGEYICQIDTVPYQTRTIRLIVLGIYGLSMEMPSRSNQRHVHCKTLVVFIRLNVTPITMLRNINQSLNIYC